jgi:hypothetical protein
MFAYHLILLQASYQATGYNAIHQKVQLLDGMQPVKSTDFNPSFSFRMNYCIITLRACSNSASARGGRITVIKRATAFIAVLILLASGMVMLAPDWKPMAQAVPQLQETSTLRPTPINEPQSTNTPGPQPTNTPVPPTKAPKPTPMP